MTSHDASDVIDDFTEASPSSSSSSSVPGAVVSAADVEFDKNLRIAVLIAEVAAGTIGGVLVLVWLWRNCRRRSRINVIILNVTVTDLLVIGFACVMQLVWELVDRNWMAGDVMCRVLKWGQSFTMMASNNMLVVLSVDRHEAIRSPLKKPISVMKMATIGYGAAAILSLPQLGVFRQNFVGAEGMFQNKTVCESIFRDLPPWHRSLYLVSISIIVFYIPIGIIAFCYVRIYLKISHKTADNRASSDANASKKAGRPGKVSLQSTRSSSFPKAKIKILKMTVVIVATFFVFGLPYHILEVALSFGYHSLVSPVVMAIFGAMAVANSAVNPYVFLLFSGTVDCWRCLKDTRPSKATDDKPTNTELHTTCVELDSRTAGEGAALAPYVTSEVSAARRSDRKQDR